LQQNKQVMCWIQSIWTETSQAEGTVVQQYAIVQLQAKMW